MSRLFWEESVCEGLGTLAGVKLERVLGRNEFPLSGPSSSPATGLPPGRLGPLVFVMKLGSRVRSIHFAHHTLQG